MTIHHPHIVAAAALGRQLLAQAVCQPRDNGGDGDVGTQEKSCRAGTVVQERPGLLVGSTPTGLALRGLLLSEEQSALSAAGHRPVLVFGAKFTDQARFDSGELPDHRAAAPPQIFCLQHQLRDVDQICLLLFRGRR